MKDFLKNVYKNVVGRDESKESKNAERNAITSPPETEMAISSSHFMKSWRFNTDSKEEQIEHELAARTGKTPNPGQWKMVKTPNNNVCVWAGAGSGKTLSLVWRVVFLHVYLEVPLTEITVLSFTNKSVQKFRNDLMQALNQFERDNRPPPDASEVASCVRTFHSKILEFGQASALCASSKKMFETHNLIDTEDTDEEALLDDIFFKSAISPQQSNKLKDIYRKLFHADEDFRKNIKKLYRHYLTSISLGEKEKYDYQEFILKKVQARDLKLTQRVHTFFKSKYKDIKAFQLNNISDLTFYANGYVEPLDLYIVFIPDKGTLGGYDKEDCDAQLKLKGCLTAKERTLISYSDKNIRLIRNQKEMQILEYHIENFLSDRTDNPPAFEFALEGDIRADDIWNVLYKTGIFIESMGLEVKHIEKDIESRSELKDNDRAFGKALIRFWQALDEILESEGLLRYHEIFSEFSETNLNNYDSLQNTSVLTSMKHLLIDEFQDISPEIARWLRGTMKYLNQMGKETSLMCIGDDWQSIYGWRGSAPYFLIDFQKQFQTTPLAEIITLVENRRSYQDLIDNADKILENVIHKTDKTVRCIRGENPNPPTLELMVEGEDEEAIKNTLHEVLQKCGERDNIFILCRTRRKKRLLNRITKDSRVKVMTFHGSKGLQAEYCILVGDCAYNTSSPFKNMIYDMSGYTAINGQNYDAAQRDETRRLAYVGVTRATEKCYWFADAQRGGCFQELKYNQLIDLEPF